jgi:gas vesicle protein
MTRIGRNLGLFAAGLAVGGAATALLTPRSGPALRKSLHKEFRHHKRSASRMARNVAGEFRSAYSSGRQVAGKFAGKLRAA